MAKKEALLFRASRRVKSSDQIIFLMRDQKKNPEFISYRSFSLSSLIPSLSLFPFHTSLLIPFSAYTHTCVDLCDEVILEAISFSIGEIVKIELIGMPDSLLFFTPRMRASSLLEPRRSLTLEILRRSSFYWRVDTRIGSSILRFMRRESHLSPSLYASRLFIVHYVIS